MKKSDANNNAEELFSIQHYAEVTNKFSQGQEGNLVPHYYGIRNVMTYDNNAGDLTSTEYFWGFILPTEYFVQTAYRDVGCEPEDGNILDPRYNIVVIDGTDSVPYYYADSERRAKYSDSVAYNPWYNWPCTGYATMKYFSDPIFPRDASNLGAHPQNSKYLRYADLLLMAAEAAFHEGQSSKSLEWVNKVRERARNSGNTGYPQAYTSITLDKIYAERRVELAFEGHQFWDLVRTNRVGQILSVDAMNYHMSVNPENGDEAPQQFGDNFIVGKSEIMPIPEAELELIKNPNFTQNPGY